MAALTQIQSVASFLWVSDDVVIFSYGGEDTPEFLKVSDVTWRDMGKPETLTVTITPGDLLNG